MLLSKGTTETPTTKLTKSDIEEKVKKLTKAKRRRLRKKRLYQVPQVDGGEAQAELPPETELELSPAVAALVEGADIESPEPKLEGSTVIGSITITPVTPVSNPPSPEPNTQLTTQVYDTSKAANVNVCKAKELESDGIALKTDIKDTDKKEVPRKNSQELFTEKDQSKHTEDIKIVEMSDKQGKKSPQKGKSVSQGQSKSPKVSTSTDDAPRSKKPEVTENVKKSPVKTAPQSKEVPAVTSVAEEPKSTGDITAEKTREEIMAERKAKKAEKAAKKGSKGGKENAKPQQEVAMQTAVKAEVTPVTAIETSSVPVDTPTTPSDTPAPKPDEKSKAALKEERRLKQEAQRAAKAAAASKKQEPQQSKPETKKPSKETPATTTVKSKSSSKPLTNIGKVLSHLQRDTSSHPSNVGIHPAVIKLGLQYSQHQVAGSNARAVALMRAMKKVIEDYETPPQSELRRDLESCMQVYMAYLDQCRPVSVSMTNAMSELKNRIQLLPASISDEEAKKSLLASIESNDKEDGFINKLDLDCCSVSYNIMEKIKDGDVILTFGCSSLVQRVLLEAKRQNKKFRVMIAGARPWKEAEKMLQCLTSQGLRCTYLLVTAASNIMGEVSKVLLGAHAIFGNGYVMARAGSAQVALLAQSHKVPVIVCCETYKFCDQVLTDSFAHNEICATNQHSLQLTNLNQCALAYDTTPPELVSAVVTEVSMLPCSSVPVVLQMQSSETRLKRSNIVGLPKP